MSIALIRKAVDLGVTLFDTARRTAPYRTKEFLGEALRRRGGAG